MACRRCISMFFHALLCSMANFPGPSFNSSMFLTLRLLGFFASSGFSSEPLKNSEVLIVFHLLFPGLGYWAATHLLFLRHSLLLTLITPLRLGSQSLLIKFNFQKQTSIRCHCLPGLSFISFFLHLLFFSALCLLSFLCANSLPPISHLISPLAQPLNRRPSS